MGNGWHAAVHRVEHLPRSLASPLVRTPSSSPNSFDTDTVGLPSFTEQSRKTWRYRGDELQRAVGTIDLGKYWRSGSADLWRLGDQIHLDSTHHPWRGFSTPRYWTMTRRESPDKLLPQLIAVGVRVEKREKLLTRRWGFERDDYNLDYSYDSQSQCGNADSMA